MLLCLGLLAFINLLLLIPFTGLILFQQSRGRRLLRRLFLPLLLKQFLLLGPLELGFNLKISNVVILDIDFRALNA